MNEYLVEEVYRIALYNVRNVELAGAIETTKKPFSIRKSRKE